MRPMDPFALLLELGWVGWSGLVSLSLVWKVRSFGWLVGGWVLCLADAEG